MTQVKRFLLLDDDNNPGVSWEPYATSSTPGVIKTDNTTLQANASNQYSVSAMLSRDGRYIFDWVGTAAEYNAAKQAGTIQSNWMCFITDDGDLTDILGKANQDLSNLTTAGDAKLQFAPFSINAGTVSSGNNYTLTYSGNILTCDACTITTADNRTRIFTESVSLDVSSYSTGTYYVFKDFESGNLLLYTKYTISKTAPSSPNSNDIWVDTSTVPPSLKLYSDSAWNAANNLVLIGKLVKSSSAITSLTNDIFNRFYYDNLSSYFELDRLADIDDKTIISLAASGTITLTANRVHKITATGTVTFSLPTGSTTEFKQMLVELYMSSAQTINLGTTYYFNASAPDLSTAGYYTLIYEYDAIRSGWVVGALRKATA